MSSEYKRLFVYSFYRFVDITDVFETKNILEQFLQDKNIRGTILIANEGINGSLSGQKTDLYHLIKKIKKILNIRKLDLKINKHDFFTFNKLKIKIKKEIVTLGKGKIDIKKMRGNLIDPSKWNELIADKDTIVLDVRNNFEIDIGNFEGSIRPNTNSFREFPEAIKKYKFSRNSQIAMYCTGGIRCEKASAHLKLRGFTNVYQLKGGIINYIQYIKKNKTKSKWKGDCFVFDNRIALDENLHSGKYVQCYACRRPLKISETKLKSYIKGTSCKYCIKTRSQSQKKRSATRQFQIDKAEKKGSPHPFKKISLNYI
tara:strand:+ start:2188 stop:3132 length:945 start_codon:yes stop_codon:yes gene_type:complete